MSITYNISTDFAAKDSLPDGDPEKVVKGAAHSTEFLAIKAAFELAAPTSNPTFTGTATFTDIAVSGLVDGRDIAVDGTKLDGIESGATGDQTGTEIRDLYEAQVNRNAFTDALKSKLQGIEAGVPTGAENQTLRYGPGGVGEATSLLTVEEASGVVATLDGVEGGGVSVMQFLTPNTTIGQISFGDPEDIDAGRIRYQHSNDSMLLYTAGAERVRIDDSGNVGIGTTSPSYKLTVEEEGTANLQITSNTASSILRLTTEAAGSSNLIYFGDADDSNAGQIRYNHSSDYLSFNANAAERMRIDDTGTTVDALKIGNFSLEIVSGELVIKHSGSSVAKISSAGAITAADDITAFGTV